VACANCHGANAKGGVVAHDISTKSASDFVSNVRAGHHPGEFDNRKEFMPKWTGAQLSDAEIRLIFGYVDGL
jgi:mono/diheme cytochrome c family protein